MEQAFTDGDASAPLNVLLGARLVLITHVHDCSGLRPIDLLAEETLKVLLDESRYTPHSALLAWPILASDALRALNMHLGETLATSLS